MSRGAAQLSVSTVASQLSNFHTTKAIAFVPDGDSGDRICCISQCLTDSIADDLDVSAIISSMFDDGRRDHGGKEENSISFEHRTLANHESKTLNPCHSWLTVDCVDGHHFFFGGQTHEHKTTTIILTHVAWGLIIHLLILYPDAKKNKLVGHEISSIFLL